MVVTVSNSTIRRARHTDRDAVLSMWESAGLAGAHDDEWQAIIHGACAKLLVSTEGGAVTGTVVVAFDGWRAYIYHVAVAEHARGRGVARALMAEAEADLLTQGARRVYVELAETNTAGMALCASMRYEPEGELAFVKDLRGH